MPAPITQKIIYFQRFHDVCEFHIGAQVCKNFIPAGAKRLLEMVWREIMKALGIQTKASLKKVCYRALVEVGKMKDIMTERKMEKTNLREDR